MRGCEPFVLPDSRGSRELLPDRKQLQLRRHSSDYVATVGFSLLRRPLYRLVAPPSRGFPVSRLYHRHINDEKYNNKVPVMGTLFCMTCTRTRMTLRSCSKQEVASERITRIASILKCRLACGCRARIFFTNEFIKCHVN